MKLLPRPGKAKDERRNGSAPRVAPGSNGSRTGTGGRPRPPGPEAPRFRGAGPGRRPNQDESGPRRAWNIFMRRWLWLLLGLLLVNYLVTPYLLPEQGPQAISIPYSTFKEQVQAGNVTEITNRGEVIQGTFKQEFTYQPPDGKAQKSTKFQTQIPAFGDDTLIALLEQHNVT